jgi:4-hydroxy-3-methylbut-2-en-1-yl diphosphate synthase IspG/GcpE
MANVMIDCPHCEGRGRIELTGVYAETLNALRRQKSEITGADLGRVCGCRGEAMRNRLARLRDLGLATCRTYGRKKRALTYLDQNINERE